MPELNTPVGKEELAAEEAQRAAAEEAEAHENRNQTEATAQHVKDKIDHTTDDAWPGHNGGAGDHEI